jgi:SAM-dependent methyltransferase
MSVSADAYIGTELELFSEARNWKAYFARKIRPFLGRDVLEVGAGIGGTTAVVARDHIGCWTCLEPDPVLAARIEGVVARVSSGASFETKAGTLNDLPLGRRFDSILYMDVLEHIEDDAGEAKRAAARLNPGGNLIVLAPAHQWLYSPFDKAVGHYRRYDKASLKAAVTVDLELVQLCYLDAVGLIASTGNRFVSKQSSPTAGQVQLWDSWMVPVSRVLDPLIGHALGKSVLGVWRRRH